MPYSEELAERVRQRLAALGTEEKKMMGGLTFMVDGKMCVGVHKDDLMVRLDPAIYDAALKRPGARPMEFTGRPMPGFVFVDADGTDDDATLDAWIALALDFNTRAQASTSRKRTATR